MFHLTARYQARLENYLEWARCTTPMDGLPSGIGDFSEKPRVACSSPEEAIFRFETFGENTYCSDKAQYNIYRRGKANRDFWTKEKGWWDKNACYLPEEFLVHLTMPCFEELFPELPGPRIHMVRQWFDDSYGYDTFMMDSGRYHRFGIEVVPEGLRIAVERDYGQNQCTYHEGCKRDQTVQEVRQATE